MTTPLVRAACGVLLVIFGVWAGAWVYSSHASRQRPEGVLVPAGEASPPNQRLSRAEPAPGGSAARATAPAAALSAADVPSADPLPGIQSTLKIPDSLPHFSLKDRAGKLTSIADFGGKSLIINFWATWCAPCQREIPLLETLHSEWAGRNVAVVGVAVDFRDKVLEFADRFKIDYPLLIGEQDALDAAGRLWRRIAGIPVHRITDRRGQVVALFVGELHRPQTDLILSVVQKLDQNSLELTQARAAIAQGLSALKAS